MLISNKNLTIRNATPHDADTLAVWWNDGAVMAHAGFPNGLNTTADEIAASLAGDSDDTHRRLIVEHNGTPVGEMNYRNKGGGTAEIGIKICDLTLHGGGLGTRLLSMLIDSLFYDYGYTRIILDTNVTNLRAQHVYQKLGFRKLRVNVDAWHDQLGNPQSSIDYELTPDDFINLAYQRDLTQS